MGKFFHGWNPSTASIPASRGGFVKKQILPSIRQHAGYRSLARDFAV
jgi:hypothetical protein